ncbi:hypothetical protein NQ317_012793 [Molorchus minor]|uniref:Uncharacterized protein n=1 Tax=Molorchus minor TaxID=1323400 RepID=A0ABQ9K550_9CUCU|nr:hypothetical protein NQ317_012793 [Molorchus minor]
MTGSAVEMTTPPRKKGAEDDAAAEALEGDAAPPEEGEAPGGEALPDEEDEDYLDPDRLILFKHWTRPVILPYKYNSLYRRIYYNDVIDYLDKRSRGIPREIPHAETWAERLIRLCRNKIDYEKSLKRINAKDRDLVEKTKRSGRYFYYHNKNALFAIAALGLFYFGRPRFLSYKCLYDYRRSYYDDVMEVLNSRRKGIRRSIPPAQTWAERFCRARASPVYKVDSFNRYLEDLKFVTRTEISGNWYKYYVKEQTGRRFSPLLF